MRWIVGVVLAAAVPAFADEAAAPPTPTPFDRGKVGVSLAVGAQTLAGVRRLVVGGGVSYFVLDGLQVGLSASHMFGDGPSITRLSPALTYVAQPLVSIWPVVPYVGGFYKHWFIGDHYDDADSIGVRTGLEFISGQLVLGIGIAFERVVSACTNDCNLVYPDISFGLAL